MRERINKENIGLFTGLIGLFSAGYFFLGPVIHELSHLMVIGPSGCEYTFRPGLNIFTGFRASYELGCAAQPYVLGLFYFSGYLGTLVTALTTFYFSNKSENLNKVFLSSLGTGMLLSIVSSISLKGDIFNGLKAFNLEAYSSFIEIILISVILLITLFEVERHHREG